MKSKKPALSKLFKGKDTYGEELKEAKAIKSGKISPQQYAKGEKMEESKKTKKMAKGGPAAGKFGPAVMAQLQSKLANRPGAGPTPPVAPRVPVRPNNAQAVAANIAANQQAAQANRAAQAARFQQMAANTRRPAPVAQTQGQRRTAEELQALKAASQGRVPGQTPVANTTTPPPGMPRPGGRPDMSDPSVAAFQQANAKFNTPAAAAATAARMTSDYGNPAMAGRSTPTGMKKGGTTKKTSCAKKSKGGCTKMAKGGGVESRGKTKGRFI